MADPKVAAMVGEALRRRRKSLKLRQADVAEFVGVTQQTIARWEDGDPIAEEHHDRVADFLDVDVSDINLVYTKVERAKLKEIGDDPLATIIAASRGEPAPDKPRPVPDELAALKNEVAELRRLVERLTPDTPPDGDQ